tara:strand:+ start:54 stop:404 length:351 start_codon:yes stop_codon:yes gene_type:complete
MKEKNMEKFYVVQTKCLDGEKEYGDIFCIKGDNIDQVNDDYLNRAILYFNYNAKYQWDKDDPCTYTDDHTRACWVYNVEEICEIEHEILEKHVGSFIYSEEIRKQFKELIQQKESK